MKRIVEIVPALPGWYARWRFTPQHTLAYPVTVWALVEETDATDSRHVVGVDAVGQWPGAEENESAGDFVQYIYQLPETGAPDDVFNPVKSPAET
jgi:hypothetical protein